MRRALARVDLGAIERNCARLAATVAPAVLCAVVKAEGYGHGAAQAARAAQAGGARWLAVATAGEADALRAGGLEGPLLVMGALTEVELDVALAAGADVVAWEEDFVAAVAARGGGAVHVKLDTGMGRLGTRDPAQADRVAAAVAAADGLRLAGAMTHLATADDDDAFVHEQLAAFRPWAAALADRHPGLLVHAANSAAALRQPGARFGMVRCGIAIYGMDPFHRDPADHGLEPALELVSYLAAVKRAEPGQSAGYGRRFVADRETWIGTIPIGYGDGVRRGLTNNADVLVGGRRVPLVGTVSMDNITVDLGDEPVETGTEAVLIGARGGERILAEDVAARLGTINYEVTCGISSRVPREYT
ncbi:MAG TPA: alanine racemase [Solirubrobacteraceae bacterium]|nr:alanine racemase [Solirubrobacteraceae bacterium]